MSKIERSWISNASNQRNLLDYENFFDTCNTLEEATKNGFIDFTHRIFTPDFYQYTGDPKTKNCLEIGFGGGRLINAADKFFNRAYGLDILDSKSIAMSKQFIDRCGDNSVILYNSRDSDLISDKSIDFVYSFIVFQHFSKYKIVEEYLKLIKRVLTPDGCGIIYFGRNDFTDSDIYEVPEDSFVDRECSLYLKENFMVDEMNKYFDVILHGVPTKKMWNKKPSMQFMIKFKNK